MYVCMYKEINIYIYMYGSAKLGDPEYTGEEITLFPATNGGYTAHLSIFYAIVGIAYVKNKRK